MIILPLELYYIIIQFLDDPDDKRPLCRLAQTCKGMRDAVTPFIYRNNTFQYPALSAHKTFDHSKLNPRYVNSITRFNCYKYAQLNFLKPPAPQDQVIAFTTALAPHLTHWAGSFAVIRGLFSTTILNNLTSICIFFRSSSFFLPDQCMLTYPKMKDLTLESCPWRSNAAQCIARMFPNLETLRVLLYFRSYSDDEDLPEHPSRPVIFENVKRLAIVCKDTSHSHNYFPPARNDYFSGKLEQLHIELDHADNFTMIIEDGLPEPDAIKILSYTAIIPEVGRAHRAIIHKRFLFQEFIPTLSNLQALELGYIIDNSFFQKDEPFSFGVTIRDILEMCPNLKILAFHHFPLQWLDRPKPKSTSSLKSHPLRLFRAIKVENMTADDIDTLTHYCTDLQEVTIESGFCKSSVTFASIDRMLAKFGPTSLQRLSFDFPTNSRGNRDMGKLASHISLLKSIAQHCSNRLQYLSLRLDLAYGTDKEAPGLLKTLLDTLRSLSRLIYLSIPENSFSSKHVYTPYFFRGLVATVADRLEEFNACHFSQQHIDLVCATLLYHCQKIRYIDVCASPSLRQNPLFKKYKHLLKFVEQYPVDYAVADLFNTRFTTLSIELQDYELSVRGSNSWEEPFRFGVLGYREVKKLVDQISSSQLSS